MILKMDVSLQLGCTDAPIHPLQQTLRALELTYSNFFAKRVDFPRFRKKGQSVSFRYPDPKQINLDTEEQLYFSAETWLDTLTE